MSEPSSERMDALFPNWQDWPVEKKEHLLKRVRYEWKLWARDEQLPPDDDDWDIWLVLAGRGFGKTRTGAEYLRDCLSTHPGARAGVIAPSYGAGRDTCIEGESGFLSVLPPEERDEKRGFKYNRSLGQVRLINGSRLQVFSGNDPERLRGPQHHYLWMDELASFQYVQETWDMAMLGLRLGVHPRILISTTPKPIPLMKELVERWQNGDKTVTITKGSTFDNAANLAGTALRALLAAYDGTHLGRQELYAELISDAPGALWSRALLEQQRIKLDMESKKPLGKLPDMVRIVVAIDPSVSRNRRSNETGIIVAGLGTDGKAYVLADLTVKGVTPDVWAKIAIKAFSHYKADRIVAEANNGGDMVEHTLRTEDKNLPIKIVYASRGKLTRAEPISALYEQEKVFHVGMFPQLEDQLTSWVPGESESPDRLDALVWAMTELMLNGGMSEVHVPGYNSAGSVPAARADMWSRSAGDGRYADRFQPPKPGTGLFYRPPIKGNPLSTGR